MTTDAQTAIRLVGDRLGMPDGAAGHSVATSAGESTVLHVDWPGGREVVLKLYRDDAGATAFETQRRLAASVGPDDRPLAIPDALFYDAGMRILVQRAAPGASLRAAIASGRHDAMAMAGRAAARLHALPGTELPEPSTAEHVAQLMRPHPLALAEAAPALRPRIEAVLDAVHRAAAAAGSHRATVHRDLHPGQMLVDDARMWLIDWDLAAAGDPALDVGNLLAWLETHLQDRDARACRDRFLAGYVDGGGENALGRTDAYRAFTYLRLACKRFRFGRDIATEVAPLIDGAEAALAA